MNEYTKQATAFLATTNTRFMTKFSRYGLHFSDDKECRDIFTCTLRNDRHKFTFKFGQSINESDGGGGNPPSPYDVLTCLEKYPVYDFADFCANYGYNNDSRKAYKIYKAVKREWENVNKLFTESELELLREIQ